MEQETGNNKMPTAITRYIQRQCGGQERVCLGAVLRCTMILVEWEAYVKEQKKVMPIKVHLPLLYLDGGFFLVRYFFKFFFLYKYFSLFLLPACGGLFFCVLFLFLFFFNMFFSFSSSCRCFLPCALKYIIYMYVCISVLFFRSYPAM